MATEEQLIAGLKAADAAGNTDDAQYFSNAIRELRSQQLQPVALQAGAQADQPSVMDRVIASPVGRFAQENIVGPALSLAGKFPALQEQVTSLGGRLPNPVSNLSGWEANHLGNLAKSEQQGYENALARNRNTSGYAAERKIADKVAQAGGGYGASDAVMAPFNSALAGLAALPGGLDASNANADAEAAQAAAYAQEHPVMSTVLPMLGGMAASPAGAVAAYKTALNAPKTITLVGETIPPKVVNKAADYVTGLAKASGVGPADIAASAPRFKGKPVTGAEAIGQTGVTGLSALARRAGITPDALAGLLTERNAAAAPRMLNDLAEVAGVKPEAAFGDIEKLLESGRAKAAPLYDEAYAANQAIASPAIDRILTTPDGQSAFKQGIRMMQNSRKAVGKIDPEMLAQAKESGQELPFKGGVTPGLKLEVLDHTKQALDDKIGKALRAGQRKKASNLIGLRNDLVSAIDKADVTASTGPNSVRPEGGMYQQARRSAGEYLSSKKAFEDGQKALFNGAVNEDQFANTVSGLSPSELEAFKGGVANRFHDLAQNGRLKPYILSTPRVQAKLETLFGKGAAKEFSDRVKIEADMAAASKRMKPGLGSPTQELADAMAQQDKGIPLDLARKAGMAAYDAARGNGVGFLTRAGDILSQYLPTKTNMMSVPVRNEAGRILMMSPEDLSAYLSKQMPPAQTSKALPFGLIPPLANDYYQNSRILAPISQ